MKKRFFTVLLALCVAFSSAAPAYAGAAPAGASAAEGAMMEAASIDDAASADDAASIDDAAVSEGEADEQTAEAHESIPMDETERVAPTDDESSASPAESGDEAASAPTGNGEPAASPAESGDEAAAAPTGNSDEATAAPTGSDGKVAPTEADSSVASSPLEDANLQFVMVGSSMISAPGEQQVVASIRAARGSEFLLKYENIKTGAAGVAAQSGRSGDLILFEIPFSDASQTGSYRLVSISCLGRDGSEREIDLIGLGMDVRFGVGEDAGAEPDEMLVDAEDAARAGEDDASPIGAAGEVSASVVTFDENGNPDSGRTIEDALYAAEKGAGASIRRSAPSEADAPLKKWANGKMVIVLDPGHDDSHTGAHHNGAAEESLTLKIAQYCREELSAYSGVAVYLTRESGSCANGGGTSTECNLHRVEFASSVGADVFVSFHLNASSNSGVNGVAVYYPNGSYNPGIGETGRGLSAELLRQLTALGLGQWGSGTMIWNSEYDKYPDGSTADYLGVIRHCKERGIPAVLIEHAFISGVSDYNNFLSSDDKLRRLGQADAAAIVNYYGLKKQAAAPTMAYTQSRSDCLRVAWQAMDGAARYEVYRDTKDAYDYKKIAEVANATYFDDETAKKGQKYYYLVRAIRQDGSASEYSSPITGMRLGVPKMSYVKADGDKALEVSWSKVDGAEGYEIFRKSGGGEYEKVGSVNSGSTLTYRDGVKSNNVSYSYKVRAVNYSNGTMGTGGKSGALSGKSLATPKVESVQGVAEKKIAVSWSKVSGAKGYELARSTEEGGKYEAIASLSSADDTGYEDGSVGAGKTYFYKVRAFNKNNGKKGYGSYSAPVSGRTVKKTKITSVVSVDAKTLEVSWKKVSGATGYRVKRSEEEDGEYKTVHIAGADDASYKDGKLETGVTYYYKVESIAKVGAGTSESGDSAAMLGRTVAAAKISYVASADSKTLEVGWGQVDGAWGYRVKRSEKKNGTFAQVGQVQGAKNTSFKDKGVATGKQYYYKVETINSVNGKKGSGGDSAAKAGKTLPAASLTGVVPAGSTSITVSWKKVSDASGYQIYRSDKKDGSYKLVASVSGSGKKSGTDKTAAPGKTYFYKVRAYKAGGKVGTGSFSSPQKAWTVEAAKFSSASGTGDGKLTLKWGEVKNATGYVIERGTGESGSFDKVAEIAAGKLQYVDKSIKAGNVYRYRVAAKAAIADFDEGRGDYSETLRVPALGATSVAAEFRYQTRDILASWGAVKNADGYQLQYATAKGGSYATLSSTAGLNCIQNGLLSGQTYYYRVRPYAAAGSFKVYGAWSKRASAAAAYEIMGSSSASATVERMVRYYGLRYQFPADVYASRGAASAEEFFSILKEEAEAEGVRAEVLFAQVILETGGLTFNGDVRPEQCNFGGIGATGGGVPGEAFPDVRTGLRAQAQHLKAYASSDELRNPCVDPRFQYVTRGSAPYVEWLAIPKNPSGKGWAADPDYGTKLLTIMGNL